jgi:hypothetical protein
MKHAKIMLALAACLAAVGGLIAQDTPPVPTPELPKPPAQTIAQSLFESKGPKSATAVNLTRMYEDIEIMRRLLHRALPSPATGSSSKPFPLATFNLNGTNSPAAGQQDVWGTYWSAEALAPQTRNTRADSPNPHDDVAGGPEGTYLYGFGVLFSMTMPLHFQEPVATPAKPEPAPLSPWDETQRELRGEKLDPADKKRAAKQASVADVVLRILADNGHHFSQLSADEQIVVSITLRPMQACDLCHKVGPGFGGMGSGPPGHAFGSVDMDKQKGGGTVTDVLKALGNPAGGAPPQKAADAGKEIEGLETQAQNFVRLGDIRLTQGRLSEGIEAYRKGADIYREILATNRKSGSKDLFDAAAASKTSDRTSQAAAAASVKLAQAYLLVGNGDQAAAALQEFTGGKKIGIDRVKSGSGTTSMRLPGKLLISASKRLMDQVEAGSVNFNGFRKAATVVYLTFPIDKATGKVNINTLPQDAAPTGEEKKE